MITRYLLCSDELMLSDELKFKKNTKKTESASRLWSTMREYNNSQNTHFQKRSSDLENYPWVIHDA